MTVTRESSVRFNGLSTDTKPSSPPTGSTFKETNTGLEFFYNGTAWVLINQHVNPIFGKKIGAMFYRAATLGGTGFLGNAYHSNITGVGTGAVSTTPVNDANGIGSLVDTGATINSITGFKCTTCVTRQFNPIFMLRFKLVATTAFRFFAGLSSTASGNPASSADYLNAISGVGLWVDSAVSANWKVMHNDGTGASTIDDTTTAFDALIHTLTITATDATPNFVVQLDGVTMTAGGTVTTDMPAQTTLMGPMHYIENTTGASKTYSCYKAWLEVDN